ncbi:MAG: TA system VapC family ribonuclease toxin [Opitutaceae bacterium]
MSGSKGDMPDVNVWLALAVAGHVHHAAAQAWVGARGAGPLVFCRVTQMALLRHLTTAAVMGPNVCTQKEAWRLYDAALSRSGTHFMSEPPTLEAVWRARTAAAEPAPKRWTDLYLTAFAHGHGLRLVTFDQGFKRMPEIEVLCLGGAR